MVEIFKKNYIQAPGDNKLSDSSKCALLQNFLGAEGQLVLTALIPKESTFSAVISELATYFRNKQPLESCCLLLLILDQLIEKTNCLHLRQRLQLERDTLSLEQALASNKEIEFVSNKTHSLAVNEIGVNVPDVSDPPVKKIKARRGRPRRGGGRAG